MELMQSYSKPPIYSIVQIYSYIFIYPILPRFEIMKIWRNATTIYVYEYILICKTLTIFFTLVWHGTLKLKIMEIGMNIPTV